MDSEDKNKMVGAPHGAERNDAAVNGNASTDSASEAEPRGKATERGPEDSATRSADTNGGSTNGSVQEVDANDSARDERQSNHTEDATSESHHNEGHSEHVANDNQDASRANDAESKNVSGGESKLNKVWAKLDDTQKGFLQTIMQVFTKPMTALKGVLAKYGTPKGAGILAGLVLVASVILSSISSFINVIFSFYCTDGGCQARFVPEMLKYWKYGDFLFETIASTVVVMLVLTGAFFGIAKLMKVQKASFWKMLSVVSLAGILMAAASFVSALIGVFSVKFMTVIATLVSLVGLVDAMAVIYEGVSEETGLESNKKVHYVLLSTIAAYVALVIIAWLIGDKIGLSGYLHLIGG